MSTKYVNPPLYEAVCEFIFIPTGQWDGTIPGMLYNEVKEKFGNKKLRPDPAGIDLPSLKNPRTKELMVTRLTQFSNDGDNEMIQVGENLLSVNVKKPYPHWEKYLPTIEDILSKYMEIASPEGFRRITLRYLNKIYVPIEDSSDLSSYFNFSLPLPKGINAEISAFNTLIEMPHNNKRDVLSKRLMSLVSDKEGFRSMLFDLNFIMNKPLGIEFENVNQWLEQAHDHINNLFEISLTDKIKKTFNHA